MTVYATRTHFTQLGLPAAALKNVSADAQDAQLSAASTKADGYLKKQFTLPLIEWGDDLREAVCAIAAWGCLTTRGLAPDGSTHETVRARHEDAIRWLEQVAAGRVSPIVTDSSTDEDEGGAFVYSDPPRGW